MVEHQISRRLIECDVGLIALKRLPCPLARPLYEVGVSVIATNSDVSKHESKLIMKEAIISVLLFVSTFVLFPYIGMILSFTCNNSLTGKKTVRWFHGVPGTFQLHEDLSLKGNVLWHAPLQY